MSKRKYSEVEMIGALKQMEAGRSAADVDFVHDAAQSGRTFRALSVVDPYTRECLALEVDTSMGSRRVTRVLEGIITARGVPQAIRSDNGPEFTSRHFLAWCAERKIEVVHIEPGKPVQNAHVESFHGKLRDECLNASWFANLFEARRKIAAWRREYNEERPHSSLGYVAPAAFARRIAALRSPTAPCEPQFGPRAETQAMSSGGSNVVSSAAQSFGADQFPGPTLVRHVPWPAHWVAAKA